MITKNSELERYYIKQYVELHKNNMFNHIGFFLNVGFIAHLVKTTGAKSLLDYGSGDGKQYTEMEFHNAWGIMPSLYDPAIEEICVLADEQFDGIICTDVMEHIPHQNIIPTLIELFNKTTKFIYFNISLKPASKMLPNGENCHITLESWEWWVNKIRTAYELAECPREIATMQVYTHAYQQYDTFHVVSENLIPKIMGDINESDNR